MDLLERQTAEARGYLETKIAEIRGLLEAKVNALEAKIDAMETRVIRWCVGTAISMASLGFVLARYVPPASGSP